MHGLKKSPLHWNARNKSADPVVRGNSGSNPFDSDDESDEKQTVKPSRASSEPSVPTQNLSTNPFDDDEIKETPSRAYSTSTARNKYKNDFQESGGFENQTVEELENYADYRAEETTKSVNSCLKIAEDMRQDATKTLITLHQQGEQITRTHMTAADIDYDLSRDLEAKDKSPNYRARYHKRNVNENKLGVHQKGTSIWRTLINFSKFAFPKNRNKLKACQDSKYTRFHPGY
ncbi:hypothetical protein K7X08_031645 [Anisodus acutangulus]|uniref:Uncharacterized protein n=1 Tax=Anisodus acutangulus TaxID=402998 RepID=A0A9Q1RJI0_9SOLA|nr:hypothetical protein K7X08_031645 [Anisodus acutangulus]